MVSDCTVRAELCAVVILSHCTVLTMTVVLNKLVQKIRSKIFRKKYLFFFENRAGFEAMR